MGFWVGRILRAKFFVDRLTKVRSFRGKCKRPMETQWNFLNTLLQRHAETGFGKKFRFREIRDIRDYQKQVPIHSWEDVAPYIEEVKKGNQDVLFPPSEKIVMYAETSGTTGNPKLIPITQSAYDLYSHWDLLWSHVLKEAPRTFYGKILYFPGDPAEGYCRDIPYGAITAKVYTQQNWLVRALYPYPFEVSRIKDYRLRYYTIMRIGLEREISLIPVANPSTILSLFRVAQERRGEIIEDIRTGHLREADQMPPEFRTPVQERLHPNPRRARELEEIYRKTGDFLPRDYWKGPITIVSFASGPLRLYLKQLNQYLENFKVFDVGLLASEGRFSFPIASAPEGCCLTMESNFFEFIPEDQIDNPDPEILTLDRCESGKSYFIIVTNASGLYRYHIHDLVEVTGFYEKVPLIAFCNKGKHTSSITGEKLTEFQVTESVRKAGEKAGIPLGNFTVCLHWDERRPSYSLLLGSNGAEPKALQEFVNRCEEELIRMNLEYLSKRQSLRLGPLTLKVVPEEEYQDYESQRRQAAHNLSQYKPVFLIGDPDFEKRFTILQEIPSTWNVSPSF